MILAQTGADLAPPLLQYGALGVLVIACFIAVRTLFQQSQKALELERANAARQLELERARADRLVELERARADRAEAELRKMNELNADRLIPALERATLAIAKVFETDQPDHHLYRGRP